MVYPQTTGYRKGSETSQNSAAIMDNSGSSLKQRDWIHSYLNKCGVDGATADEITDAMQMADFKNIHNGTVAGQIVHLEKLFLAKKTEQRRVTSAGRPAIVYIAWDGTPYEIPKSKREQAKEDLQMCANFMGSLIDTKKINDGAWADRAPFIKATLDRLIADIP